MINIFGTTISAPPVLSGQLYEGILADVAKKADERELLRSFLDSPSLAGISRLEEIVRSAKTEAANLPNVESSKPQATQFYLSQLKQSRQSNGQTTYEDLILKIISTDDNFPSAPTARKMLQGKTVNLPDSFPVDHNKAENLFYGTLSSSIGECQCRDFQTYQLAKSRVQNIVKDLFFAINHDLSQEQSGKFIAIIYELSKLKTALLTKPIGLKLNIINALLTEKPLQLVHVKCLRFVYPKTGGVRILIDINDTTVDGVLGRYSPKSEVSLFDRLSVIQNVFQHNGVSSSFKVVLSDEDIDLLFPDDHPFVSSAQKQQAKADTQRYFEFIKLKYQDRFDFTTINELAGIAGSNYQQLRSRIIEDLRGHKGAYMSPDFYERDRVDHQYTYYQQLFGPTYSRQEARRSISEQVASVIALQELLKVCGENVILIEENREGENRLIAGGNYPIYFTHLRDEAKYNLS